MGNEIIIPTQASKIGDEITYEGIKLRVGREFSQGADAKASNFKYFMPSPKGVFGLEEI